MNFVQFPQMEDELRRSNAGRRARLKENRERLFLFTRERHVFL